MNKYKIFRIIPILFIIITFYSCISIERSIKINEDGSGKETMTIKYGKNFFDFLQSSLMAFDSVKGKSILDSIYNENMFAGDIKEKYKNIEGIKLQDVKTTMEKDSSVTLKVSYTFTKLENTTKAFQLIGEEQGVIGDARTVVHFKKDGKKYHFRYKYKMADDEDTAEGFKNSLSSFFKDQKIVFKITFPFTVKSSNATKTNDKTLTWDFDLEKFMSKPNEIDLNAELKK